MALTTTTTSAAIANTDRVVNLTSVSGLTAGMYIKIDEEFMQVGSAWTTAANPVNVTRGMNGTAQIAHVSGANAVFGTGSDFGNPNSTVVTAYALSGRRRKLISYSASGAITLPSAGEDMDAVLNGTSTLTMTLAAPGKDLDGSVMTVIGNGKSQSTVAVSGNDGVGNAGSGYRTYTFQNAGQVSVSLKACNGEWVALNTPITGTTTAISVAIA